MLHPALDRYLPLGCFSLAESLSLLRRPHSASHETPTKVADALSARAGPEDEAARQLAEAMGHLPLALAMCATYMRRCDVGCAEYLTRFSQFRLHLVSDSPDSRLQDYALGVAGSLSMSLSMSARESPLAQPVLECFAFLAPSDISQAFVPLVLRAISVQPALPQSRLSTVLFQGALARLRRHSFLFEVLCSAAAAILGLRAKRMNNGRCLLSLFVFCASALHFLRNASQPAVPAPAEALYAQLQASYARKAALDPSLSVANQQEALEADRVN
jgi:hypothetical protein